MNASVLPPSSPPVQHTARAGDASDPRSWRGDYGTAYALRNPREPERIDDSYLQRFGVTRTRLNERFLRAVPRYARVLEVGCSHGGQLRLLREMGFRNVVGVDLCREAMLGSDLPVAVADGAVLPFRDGSFDLVFTSGTLMHVPPGGRAAFCAEVLRVTARWVWGMECWADPGVCWRFPGVAPHAWALPEPDSYLALGGVRLVERLLLRHREQPVGRPEMLHVMFMLEKA